MRRRKTPPSSQEGIEPELEQVDAPDAVERLRRAYDLSLKAAARAEGATLKCGHDAEDEPKQAGDTGVTDEA